MTEANQSKCGDEELGFRVNVRWRLPMLAGTMVQSLHKTSSGEYYLQGAAFGSGSSYNYDPHARIYISKAKADLWLLIDWDEQDYRWGTQTDFDPMKCDMLVSDLRVPRVWSPLGLK